LATIQATKRDAEQLGIRVGDPVLWLRRVRMADGVAVSVMENWLPNEFSDISNEDLSTHGLYQLLRSRGVNLRVAKQRIGARKANADEAKLLDIDKGAALLTMDRTAYDNSGRAIEYGHHCYRPDLYSFEVTLVEK
jgi:DNA-binding GntR family transcriptional regulator